MKHKKKKPNKKQDERVVENKSIGELEAWKKEFFEGINKPEEEKNVRKCINRHCSNDAMSNSEVCVECYEEISSEMAKTVKKGDDKPLKISKSYQNLQDLINGDK